MKKVLWVIALSVWCFFGCSNDAALPVDCYPGRADVKFLQQQTGTVLKLGDGDFWVISLNAQHTDLLLPCNLPAPFRRQNLSIYFNGIEKEIYPEERWPGRPFILTAIALPSGPATNR